MTITRAFQSTDPSIRLRAALAAGTDPNPAHLVPLMERLGGEPHFFVRDMVTWALTRHPVTETFPLLTAALNDPEARSQALHTLSKIQAPGTWEVLTTQMLHDANAASRTAAWRLAVAVVPDTERAALATELVAELGRGDEDTQRSLIRALAALDGEVNPLLSAVIAHAQATQAYLQDPDGGIADHLHEARRVAALGPVAQN
ncbi:HEAT repeat domain-containing protein [Corynebacterium gallinarum]|uniref:HEAT repeat domain-containing protein n=1 Tax=Corynebacterium gallinarum TaxID=2762214 RepID=A0A8I0HNA7_9CORY|nr:HEAT repeat domain-containing protein [Corynebacterium gallinarum]MBD8028928.1 HEAT repeat domain-containing protein [Corynebacterium gallinarum]